MSQCQHINVKIQCALFLQVILMVYCYFVGPVAALHPAFSIILVKHSYPDICSPVMVSTFYNLNKDKVCQHITHYTHYTFNTRQWTWTLDMDKPICESYSHIPSNSGVTDLMPTNISISCHLLLCYEQHINILPPKQKIGQPPTNNIPRGVAGAGDFRQWSRT